MNRWNVQFTVAVSVALIPWAFSAQAGDLDLGVVGPIGQVGPIGKVGPIGQVEAIGKDPVDGARPADAGYVVSWTWSMTQEPKWRSTQKYANLQEARDFANYQNERYDEGQAVFIAVNKKNWDDPETRKKIMERIAKEVIPSALERAAGKVEVNNPDQAARLRKQIKFVEPEWVDVKPVLSTDSKEYKALKAGEVQVSTKAGYDDSTGKGDIGSQLVGTWKNEYAGRAMNGDPTFSVHILRFKDDGSAEWSYSTSDTSDYARMEADALRGTNRMTVAGSESK